MFKNKILPSGGDKRRRKEQKMKNERDMRAGLIVPPRKFVLGELQGKGIYPDRLIAHKDGSFTVKESYYYRHGQSPEKIADKIKKAIHGIEIIDTEDEWRAWPKTSYFVVKFRIKTR